mgnify:CR=1
MSTAFVFFPYAVSEISLPVNNTCENLFVSVSIGSVNLIVGGVYIPPSSNIDVGIPT